MKKIYLKFVHRVLAYYASVLISKFNPFVIAVTGSVGKTMTKEAIFRVLNDQFGDKVRKNEGNLNSEIGVPLTILGYKKQPNHWIWPLFLIGAGLRIFFVNKYPKYLIVEMGIDKPGDMKYLTSIIKPDIAVITSLSGAHLGNFHNIEEYRTEKLEVIQALKKNGIVIVNADEKELSSLNNNSIVRVGIKNASCDYCAQVVGVGVTGTDFRISSTGHKISIKSKLIGSQLVYPDLIAFAIGDILKIQLLKVSKSLEKLLPVLGRMNLIKGINNTLILDDTYNANPISVRAGLENLANIDYSYRRVAILGNMNELGAFEDDAHREIGLYAKGKCDLAIFVGPNASKMRQSFDDNEHSMEFPNRESLISDVRSIIKSRDLIYIKASQNNNFFEEVVKTIMLHPEKSDELLVRQGKEWMKKKVK